MSTAPELPIDDRRLAEAIDDAVAHTEAELYALGHGILAAIRAGTPAAATISTFSARSGYGELELTRAVIALLNNHTRST